MGAHHAPSMAHDGPAHRLSATQTHQWHVFVQKKNRATPFVCAMNQNACYGQDVQPEVDT